MYHLHYYPGNASFAPHVLLREIGAPYELCLVDRTQNAQKSEAYLKLNPTGRIPVLVDDDLVLFETAAICLHLCDRHPEAGLAPALGTAERAQFYKWLIFMTNTIQPDVLVRAYSDRYTTDPNGVAAVKDSASRRLSTWFQVVEDSVGAGPYLLGNRFSAADVFLLMVCRWGRLLPHPPRDLPKLRALAERVLERDAVKAAITAEGLDGEPFLGS